MIRGDESRPVGFRAPRRDATGGPWREWRLPAESVARSRPIDRVSCGLSPAGGFVTQEASALAPCLYREQEVGETSKLY